MQYFKDKVLLGNGRCEVTNMQATGIPDHLCIVEKITSLENEVRQLKQVTINNHEVMRREVHQEQIDTRNALLDVLSEQPTKLKSVIMENFNVEGVTPITVQDIQRIMTERDEILISRLTHLNHNQIATNIEDPTNPQTVIVRRPLTDFQVFHWGGKHRMCPEDFEFPLFDVATMFNLWHFGNSELGIQPYKHFENLREKKHKNNFDRARLVMTEIDNIFENHHLLGGDYENISKMNSIEEQNNAFSAAYVKLLEICYDGPKKRPNDITLSTLASKLYCYKKQRINN